MNRIDVYWAGVEVVERRRAITPQTTCWRWWRGPLNGTLETYAVSTVVNNVRNNGPELMQPFEVS